MGAFTYRPASRIGEEACGFLKIEGTAFVAGRKWNVLSYGEPTASGRGLLCGVAYRSWAG